MKTRIRHSTLALLGFLLVLLGASLTVQAQRQVDLLMVQVVYSDGSPVANVQVMIESDTCLNQPPYVKARLTDVRGMALDTVLAFRCQRPARYWVSLIDCNGNRLRQQVTVGQTPMPVRFVYCRKAPVRCVATFSWTESNGTVTFVNGSQPTSAAMLWDFGDGNRSNTANPTHTYARPGRYNVCLTISTPDGCTSRMCAELVAGDTTAPPTRCKADFAVRPAPTASNTPTTTFHFIDQSQGNNLTYFWNFGDGNYSNEPSPRHTYARPGTYEVCLTVLSRSATSNAVCSDTTCRTVTVEAPPARCKAEFAIAPTSSNDPRTFAFVSRSTGDDLVHIWNFGDGNYSNEPNPTHTYARPGTYRVCLTVVNRSTNPSASCSDSTCQTITLPARCKAEFRMTPAANNTGHTFAFVSQSTGDNLVHIWDFGDGNRSNEPNPTHTYVRPGNYLVCLTVVSRSTTPNTSCSDSTCRIVTIPAQPVRCKASFAIRPATNSATTFNFINQSIGDNLAYFWDFGDGNRSNEANPTHTYTRPGNYLVCLIASSRSANTPSTSCFDSTCQVITVAPQPARCKADFEVRQRNTGFVFVNRSQPANNTRLQYVWNFGDGNRSNAVNPSHTYARPGRYQVCLTVTAPDGCTDTKCEWVSTGPSTTPIDTTRSALCFNVRLSDGQTPADAFTVILYRLDPTTNRYVPVDTLPKGPSTTPNQQPVCFRNLPPGQYIALGQLTARSQHRTTHIPTYYDRSQTWRNARVIDTRQAHLTVVYELVLLPRIRTSNTRTLVQGRASVAAGKAANVGVSAWVLAVDAASNQVVGMAETDASGRYMLSGLPYGTYRLVAEAINFHDRPVHIQLSPETPTIDDADLSLSEEPMATSRGQHLTFSDMSLYPNPTSGLLWVKAPWLTAEPVTYSVLGTDGRVLRQWQALPTEAIDLTDLPQGLYLLRVVQGSHGATRSLLRN